MFNNSASPSERHISQGTENGATQRDSQQREQLALPPFICISSTLRRLLLQGKIASAHTQMAAVEGEPGTGKHLFAQTMHRQSALGQLPFHRSDAREWLASEADTSILSGTLYLDRVDLLASTGQGLLLNLIKTLEVTPPPRFLLLTSSHTPLRQLASQGQFMPDLAFRLSAVRFFLPPLRDHREDIAPIVQALLDRICTRYRQPAAILASGTLPRLLQHAWPGNVRELASALESAVLESKTGVIRPADLVLEPLRNPDSPQTDPSGHLSSFEPAQNNNAAPYPSGPGFPASHHSGSPMPGNHPSSSNLAGSNYPASAHPATPPEQLTLNAAINRHIQYVLQLNRGNKLRAARQLDISRSTLYRILAGESISSAPSAPNPEDLPSK